MTDGSPEAVNNGEGIHPRRRITNSILPLLGIDETLDIMREFKDVPDDDLVVPEDIQQRGIDAWEQFHASEDVTE